MVAALVVVSLQAANPMSSLRSACRFGRAGCTTEAEVANIGYWPEAA